MQIFPFFFPPEKTEQIRLGKARNKRIRKSKRKEQELLEIVFPFSAVLS